MATDHDWIGILHVALAVLSVLLSLGAPFTKPRHVKHAFWCCLLLVVLAWSSALLLIIEAGCRQQEPSLLLTYHTTLFAQAATIQLDRLYDDDSRAWDLYAWSWVVGSGDQVLRITSQLSTTQSFDIWSYLELVLALSCLSAFGALLSFFGMGFKRRYERVRGDDKPVPERPTVYPAVSSTKPHGSLHPTAEEETQEAAGLLDLLTKYQVFWPVTWPVGNHVLQLCLVLAFAITLSLKPIEVWMTQNLGLLIDELREAEGWHDIYPSLQLWAVPKLLLSQLGLPVLRTFLWMKVTTHRQQRLQEIVHAKIMSLDSSYHFEVDPHDTTNTADLGRGVDQILDSVLSTIIPSIAVFFSAIPAITQTCGLWIVPIQLNWAILYGIIIRRCATAVSRLYAPWLGSFNTSRRHYQDSITGWKALANFNQIESQITVGKNNAQARFIHHWNYLTTWFMNEIFDEALVLLNFFLGAFLVIGRVIHGKITVGDFSTYLLCWRLLMAPIRSSKQATKEILEKLQDTARLRRLLEMEPGTKKEKALEFRGGKVEFQHVSFGYGKTTALEGFNHTFTARTTTAIVGPSGCGKSTIFRLLMGHANPQNGRILIDGQDIKEISDVSLRKFVGIMEQAPHIFNETFLDNLLLANGSATMEAVHQACRKACFDTVVKSRPAAYGTSTGVNGENLSGGEKQRLALAAVFLRDPYILLLDEATSALDSATETTVKGNIDKQFKGRTVIISAHRLSSIITADQIVVLGPKGTIVELGTHMELLEKKSTYWTMWQQQVGEQP